ncbi:PBP1A family penicillin-binding protein [Campylobacter sp. RM12920]|uniref:PBP1A family penicillin-binding protein n=1 Tax=Campylobacter californiensis TaxID=1032243 RepID=A0ABD4JHP1_9BACT|nr:PBP1A family penicillin-binding protein [Campylobacter sp. RM9328]MBE2986127.1 PBP1A family penicillin-binding protein [Campylobacter sp. RM12919]MBE2987540.1 PBP1A family penicillin-binding protein [Campylobacter sp. RM12920]MBE3022497.1 PBP1A family penicillin-binding protein [Campylobacter sp. 7477a]
MKYILWIFFAGALALGGGFVYIYSQVRFDAYSIIDYKPKLTTQIFDRNNELIANIFEENRVYVKYEEIPSRVVEALVAIEDTSYFEHGGINYEAIVRAVIKDIKAGRFVEGASTLTQQLVKNLALSSEKKIMRKIKEIVLAIKLETELDKEQIIERYLNHVYFGHGYYGIKTAADGYFRKDLKELSIKEIAMLVGLPKAPSSYDPTKHLDLSLGRANRVLERMYTIGWLNEEEYRKGILEEPAVFDDTLSKNKAPYVVDEIIKEVSKRVDDIRTGGYKIYSTVDLNVQKMANEALIYGYNEILKRDKKANANILNGAIVVTQPQTGHILALVGGVDYSKSSYNRATQSARQPGSSFKPFIYQIALDEGYSVVSQLADIARSFDMGNGKEWTPKNYSGGFQGYISLKSALTQSRNLATINLLNDLGLSSVRAKLSNIGFQNIPENLSIALGSFGISPVNFAKFYSMFPNEGEIVEPILIKYVENSFGAVVNYEAKKEQVLKPEQAFLMIDLLKNVVNNGTGRNAKINGIQVAGKTGTTNNNIDAWFCGFTPDVQAIIWYGNDDNSPMKKIEGGGRTAAPVFKKFMETYIKQYPTVRRVFEQPEGVYKGIYNGVDELYTNDSPLPEIIPANEIIQEQENNGLMF